MQGVFGRQSLGFFRDWFLLLLVFNGKQNVKKRKICRRQSESDLGDAALSPLLRRIFENRNLTDLAELTYPLARLLLPDTLKAGARATQLLFSALKNQQSILIIGDYDTDGATATALGLIALRAMGANNVGYLVPNRFEFGYGLSVGIAEIALQKRPDLVITVDNGISSVEGVALLKQKNISVIITDHHLAGEVLPDADAILNPNQPGCAFPSKTLAGVGVMFYLLLLLRAKLKAVNWFEDMNLAFPNLAEYLDLVALGTVADLVPLDYNNRILVEQGVARIKAGKCRAGIRALMAVGARHPRTKQETIRYREHIIASDLGFVVAPKLNAAGRLKDISTGIECLLADNDQQAWHYATQLNEINLERQQIEKKMQSQAMAIVRAIETAQPNTRATQSNMQGFCLYESGWHQGITGLIASRIKDKTDQPVVAFADSADNRLSGSVRSVYGLHIKDMLENISSAHPGLLITFGGHAMAAGLTIDADNLQAFRTAFHCHVARYFDSTSAIPIIYTDGDLSKNEMTLDTAETLRLAAPWGQGFLAPLFDGTFTVIEQKVVGESHLRFTLQRADMTENFQGIAFRAIEPGQPPPQLEQIHAVYQLCVNDFRCERSLQLLIEHFQPVVSA